LQKKENNPEKKSNFKNLVKGLTNLVESQIESKNIKPSVREFA